jgi:hypothetical protein
MIEAWKKQPRNIWSKRGCELPSGGLCDACCNVKAIDSPWGKKRFLKIPGDNCDLMKRPTGKGQGCGVHGMMPDSCEIYHCSDDLPAIKERLVAYSLNNELVTKAEASQALDKIRKER